MFDGLSRREVFAWVFCLALAIGLVSGGAYFVASSFMSADVADTMPQSAHSRAAP
jgi:hypothetical protein